MMKVAIFGATGTVGAYAALHFKKLGYKVIAIGRRFSDNGFFGDYDIEYYSVDVTKSDDFKKLPQDGIEVVVNLAGMLPARMEGYHPQQYIDINCTGALNILEYSSNVGVKKFIYSQSISDVGYLCGQSTPIPSDSISKFPLNNDHSIYSITKNAAVNMVIHFAAKYNFEYYILRFPNIYLYHPDPTYYVDGEKKWQGYRLMIARAQKGESLSIWGDPSKVRDVVYVKDCCQIIEKCVSSQKAESGTYNVGTGIGTSLEEQVRGIAEVFCPKGKKIDISYDMTKPDASEYVFDMSKTEDLLGYKAQYGYRDYLEDFKREFEAQTFAKLWGTDKSGVC